MSDEPWLRGALAGVHPLVMPVFFSFQQVREDLARHTAGLSSDEVWCLVGANSLGFQLKHIAGSVDRITTYLMGESLNSEQLAFLSQEAESEAAALGDLLHLVEECLAGSEKRLLTIDPAAIYEARIVGRRALPTSVIGLIVHLAEHTQRHLGQVITITNVLRQSA